MVAIMTDVTNRVCWEKKSSQDWKYGIVTSSPSKRPEPDGPWQILKDYHNLPSLQGHRSMWSGNQTCHSKNHRAAFSLASPLKFPVTLLECFLLKQSHMLRTLTYRYTSLLWIHSRRLMSWNMTACWTTYMTKALGETCGNHSTVYTPTSDSTSSGKVNCHRPLRRVKVYVRVKSLLQAYSRQKTSLKNFEVHPGSMGVDHILLRALMVTDDLVLSSSSIQWYP